VPILWSMGTGSDVMKRIAAPMVKGIFTSFLLELLAYPAIYQIWKWHFELKKQLFLTSVERYFFLTPASLEPAETTE
jgi:hypothetical protein